MKLISDPPPRKIVRPDQIDNLGEAVLALTREVWVLTDRLAVVETLLEKQGVLKGEAVDNFAPDEAFEKTMTGRGRKLISAVETALRK